MSDEPQVVATGERGPTGDHGQTGDRGRQGVPGPEGMPGIEGPPGHIGLTGVVIAPSRSLLLSVLKTVTALMAGIIVAAALWVAIDSARDENRLVADRDALREQLADIQQDRAHEQEQENCRNLYLVDITVTESVVVDDDLFSIVVELPPSTTDQQSEANLLTIREAVANLEAKKADHRAAVAAFVEYVAIDPPPGQCPHPDN